MKGRAFQSRLMKKPGLFHAKTGMKGRAFQSRLMKKPGLFHAKSPVRHQDERTGNYRLKKD